jgi:hypothetical protein
VGREGEGRGLEGSEGLEAVSRKKPRGAHASKACADGSLIIYATMPDGHGEPLRTEPHRVMAVIPPPDCPCGCCVEVRNLIAHKRHVIFGCHCASYEEHERCDCGFCVAPKSTGN